MKHIVNFSGGLCSFWAAHRIIAEVGAENVTLLFADTLIESPDLYEFNAAASALIGIQITRVSVHLTPWQLFRREGLIGNNRFPICSTKLKREPLNDFMKSNYEMDAHAKDFTKPNATVVLGFDWTESHRVKAMQESHPTWSIRAPMTEPPYWDKCKMQREAEALGLPIPSAYVQGFPHNNCGRRCVRAGISHWVHLYRVDKPAFMDWAHEEQLTMEDFKARGITPLTMLKDRRGGETNSLSLMQLVERIESGEKFRTDEWGGCGCGGAGMPVVTPVFEKEMK